MRLKCFQILTIWVQFEKIHEIYGGKKLTCSLQVVGRGNAKSIFKYREQSEQKEKKCIIC